MLSLRFYRISRMKESRKRPAKSLSTAKSAPNDLWYSPVPLFFHLKPYNKRRKLGIAVVNLRVNEYRRKHTTAAHSENGSAFEMRGWLLWKPSSATKNQFLFTLFHLTSSFLKRKEWKSCNYIIPCWNLRAATYRD